MLSTKTNNPKIKFITLVIDMIERRMNGGRGGNFIKPDMNVSGYEKISKYSVK